MLASFKLTFRPSSLRASTFVLYTTTRSQSFFYKRSKPLASRIMSSSSNNKFAVQNLFNVQDWVVVISGGGTGIGLMIAQAFANNGARVYILGRREDALCRAVEAHGGDKLVHPSGKIVPLPCDITSKESIENFIRQLAAHERHVDVLVNNAGISQGTSAVEKGDESPEALSRELWEEKSEDWGHVYKTNVMG